MTCNPYINRRLDAKLAADQDLDAFQQACERVVTAGDAALASTVPVRDAQRHHLHARLVDGALAVQRVRELEDDAAVRRDEEILRLRALIARVVASDRVATTDPLDGHRAVAIPDDLWRRMMRCV